MSEHTATSESGSIAIDRPHPPPTATWTIDPTDSSVTLAWRKLRPWTVTGRLRCQGVVHLDDLPPVGVIRFEQPSGLPILTMALDPASIQTHDADLDTRLRSSEVLDVLRHRWWTLRSDSLEILPTGTWRVMATLTAKGISGPVELFLEVDPAASSPDWLALRGHGQLDRQGFGIGSPVSTSSPQIWLDLAVRARRVGEPASALRVQGVPQKPTARDRSGGIQLTNRHVEVVAQVPMHRVAVRTGPQPSDLGTTAASQPPIGHYRRLPVQVHPADPHAPEVARRLIALIASRWPATPAEHIGSTAVPGLAGKNIIDLLLAAPPAHIPAITQALGELGFQPQRPAAFPATRPMLWGTFGHEATQYAATLAHLGLADEQPRRLYQDGLDPDNPDRLAS